METMKAMKNRYSSRKYQDKKIDRELLLEVLEAARIAPSACNYQPWHFIVIDDVELIAKLPYRGGWIKSAPAVIVACGDHSISWVRSDKKDHMDVDVSIAIDHITLKATDSGLSTCWICAFDARKTEELLNLPDNIEAVALIPIGFPADSKSPDRHADDRKKIEEIVSFNEYK